MRKPKKSAEPIEPANPVEPIKPPKPQPRELTDHIVSGDQAVQLKIEVMDEPGAGGACHRYEITGMNYDFNMGDRTGLLNDKVVIMFQNGPIKESGINGITQEVLLAIIIDRLKGFQAGEYNTYENQMALMHAKASLALLQKRTLARIARGVEGTSVK